ncbi:hypothetical protein J2T15_003536 [Paenibacillus harenae]|uniref:Uncharacterized protein n=1 Tax=Paenibacillus harenae TaxID=306543 RepID=A0ABT9U362_PAEHA|nr:hypothetical protein [Paenibacillus harenae]
MGKVLAGQIEGKENGYDLSMLEIGRFLKR